MHEIKTPPAHNKFMICSISPTSQRARAQLPRQPHGKWTFRQGDKKSSYSPQDILHPDWNKLCSSEGLSGGVDGLGALIWQG